MQLWCAVLPGLYLPCEKKTTFLYILYLLYPDQKDAMRQSEVTMGNHGICTCVAWTCAACSCLWSVLHIKSKHHTTLWIAENLSVWWMHEYSSDCLSVKYIEISQWNKGHFPSQFADSVRLGAKKSFAIWMSFNQSLMGNFSVCWSY